MKPSTLEESHTEDLPRPIEDLKASIQPVEEEKQEQAVATSPIVKESVASQKNEVAVEKEEASLSNPDLLRSVVKEEMMSVFEDMMSVMQKDNEAKRIRRDKNLYQGSVHEGVTCDMCKVSPIVGIRYKSATRDDYDLCIDCESKAGHEDIYLKIKKAGDYQKFLEDLKAQMEVPEPKEEIKKEEEEKSSLEEEEEFEYNEQLKVIIDMGYSQEEGKKALRAQEGSVELAISQLLNPAP